MRAVILVPRRAGIPARDEAWDWCRRRWQRLHPDLPVYEGEHDDGGPFNRAAALNTAARLADADGRWDLAVVVDADIFLAPEQVREAVRVAGRTGKVTWAFQRWNGLNRDATEAIVARGELEPVVEPGDIEKTNPISWSCCFVVPRAVWEDLGGFDERFRGWGWEDMAFQSVVCGLYGHRRVEGDLYHLWHPRADERIQPGSPLNPAYVANRMLGRRYMYALRMLGLHDRATESDEAEMERDRANLQSLAAIEELDAGGRPRPGMPDWRDWWPSLEELREQARQGTTPGPAPRLAIVVRSGGTLESWPARSGYLRKALASLEANVSYEPTVARVVFADWPNVLAPKLAAIAERHGFYVVGGEGNRGFTPSMTALWRYMRSRGWPYDFAFLAEDDFVYERPVPIAAMMQALRDRPELLQLALLRDAFYAAERDAGGILGHPLSAFTEVESGEDAWLEHRRFFTLNPTLVRRSLFARPWPVAQHSEAVFGRQEFARDPAAASGLWGRGETWIRHLGEVRAGAGY